MNARTRLRTYAAILTALVALFVVGAVFGPRRGKALGMVYSGLAPVSVEGIQISSDLSIKRDGQSWIIDEGSRQFPARTDRVQSLLDALAAAALVRRITSNENLWPEFGLTDDTGTPLTIRSSSDGGERIQTVIWGESAAEAGLSYLRVGESPDVYASDGEVQFYLRQPVSYWSYLRLLPEDVNTADVIALSSSVDVSVDEDERILLAYDLEREVTPSGERWIARDSDELAGIGDEPATAERLLDSDAVSAVLRDVVDLVGTDFSRELRFDPLPVVGNLDLALADGREFRVEILQSDETFICRVAGPQLPGDPFGGIAYELSSAKVRRLFPELSTLLSD